MLFVTDMAWPWNNPSKKQAQEAYNHYKKKYNQAAQAKRRSENEERTYVSQKNSLTSQQNTLNAELRSLEKRLQGVEELIKMLDSRGGWFSVSVPEAISKVRSAVKRAAESFRKSIKHSGFAAADLEENFKIKTVSEDTYASAALKAFEKEKRDLEEQIANNKRSANNLSAEINALKKKIRACNNTQSELRGDMNSYLYDMEHYWKKMQP